MLKHRVITAIVLALLLLWAVFFWSSTGFSMLLLVVSWLSAWEWSRMCELRQLAHRGTYMAIVGSLAVLPVFVHPENLPAEIIVIPGFVFWLLIAIHLSRNKTPVALGGKANLPRMLLAIPLFALAVWGLMWLRNSEVGSPLLFIYVFCIVWLADIGAYFAGRRWGKTKLASNISAGKTCEGVVGGLVAVTLWALLFVYLAPFDIHNGVFLLASLMAGVFSIVGDLFESVMKRSAGIKDSGAVLPGHGGILDRIDSLLAAVPVFIFIVVMGA